MPQHMLYIHEVKNYSGAVHVLAALFPGTLHLAADQCRESFHDWTASELPLAGGANSPIPRKNTQKIRQWKEL